MTCRAVIFTIVLLLAGCAGLRSPVISETEAEERQVLQLIAYAQRAAAMTAEQQRREYGAVSQAFSRDKDQQSRMRLALLLATPGTGIHDAARAASLLEPLAAPADAPGPLRSFARLLYAQLTERASEQKRAGQMREKLDALREVERTIMERGQESQPRRR